MTPGQQFWWNWAVRLAAAIGTFLAVLVALFGQQFRAKRFPPRLKLKLLEKGGEKTTLTARSDDGTVRNIDDVRYFHLRLWNERRWSTAEGVQVFLTRLDEPGPDNQLRVTWLGNVPLRWRDQEFVPVLQTIGAAKDCDFCMIGKRSGLSLMPLLLPNNLPAHRPGKCRVVAWLQARSNQADSEIVRIEIAWDGLWVDGDFEMQQHLVIKELGPERK
jgi:hypothetical protein